VTKKTPDCGGKRSRAQSRAALGAATMRIHERTLSQLRENEIDLQTELADLADEIQTREARIVEVQRHLRETRRLLRAAIEIGLAS
jgi:uncharacterized protein involved in exopolysaccharide biosynthesis